MVRGEKTEKRIGLKSEQSLMDAHSLMDHDRWNDVSTRTDQRIVRRCDDDSMLSLVCGYLEDKAINDDFHSIPGLHGATEEVYKRSLGMTNSFLSAEWVGDVGF